MALIDVVKWDANDKEFCHKFPSDDLRIGSQLIVYPAQTAFFVKGGKIYDEFETGTFTIKSENIPLLNKIVNLPFGGSSPFKAEVWFINQITKLDIKWGTLTPINLEDPKYNIIVPVRAYGQYGIKIVDPRKFLETLIGNMASFTAEKIDQYFKGKILAQLSSLISQNIIQNGISILDINAHLIDMSEYCNEQISRIFEKYGISVIEFSFASVNVPNDDPSVMKLKEAKDLAARLKITGQDVYRMERGFNVMETAAANEGIGGGMVAMGAGLGMGVGVGGQMGNMFNQNMTQVSGPPPLISAPVYFLAINNQQSGGFDAQAVASFIHNGQINSETLIWKQGLSTWVRLASMSEFMHLFSAQTPPPLNQNMFP